MTGRGATALLLLAAVGLVATETGAGPVPSASPTPPPRSATPTPAEPTPVVTDADLEDLHGRGLRFPVPSISPATVRDSFTDRRGKGPHEALDIAAPRGAPVVAVDDGVVAKLFESVPGGHTIYVFDAALRFAYYYAHLDAYAPGLAEGQPVRKGDVIGTVGTSGNAGADDPHLHFAIFKLEPTPRWWRGTPVNPHPLLVPPR